MLRGRLASFVMNSGSTKCWNYFKDIRCTGWCMLGRNLSIYVAFICVDLFLDLPFIGRMKSKGLMSQGDFLVEFV